MGELIQNARFELPWFRISSSRVLDLLLITATGMMLIFPAFVWAQETITVQPAGRVTWDQMLQSEVAKQAIPEVQRRVVAPFMPAPEPREIGLVPARPYAPSEPVESPPREPSPLGPSLQTGFQALPDDTDDSGYSHIPPDTMGAAGPSHLMTMLNSQVRIQDKSGGIIGTVGLDTFWSAVTGSPFDPRLVYDSIHGRWIATCAGDGRSVNAEMCFAISDTSDPTGTWSFYDFDADLYEPLPPSRSLWVDFPDIGVNTTWIAITANMFYVPPFDFLPFPGAKMWVIDKSTALAGGTITVTVFLTGFDESGGVAGFTLRPCVTFGSEPKLYIVDDGYWNGENNMLIRMSEISGTGDSPTWAVTPGSPFPDAGVFFVSNNFDWDQIDAPQQGTGTLVETNDPRVLNAVFRNGMIWCTHSGGLPVGAVDRTAVFWYQLDPALMALSGAPIVQSGVLDGGAGVHHFFTSIAVNKDDHVCIGFSRSHSGIYVEAVYTGRFAADPAGQMDPISVLKEGEDSYVKDFDSGRVRWGDYSATVVDPTDDVSFWTIQEYAALDVGSNPDDDRWGTWWGSIFGTPTSVDLISLAATEAKDGRILIQWKTGYEVDNLGFHVYRDEGGERMRLTPELLAGSALLAGAGTPLTAGWSYTWWDTLPPGIHLAGVRYWLEDVDLDGTRTWHGPIHVEPSPISNQLLAMETTSPKPLSKLGRKAGEERPTVSLNQAKPRTAQPEVTSEKLSKQWDLAGQKAIKILIEQEGWYRIGQPKLVAAGLSPDADPAGLQLYTEGTQQRILVTGQRDGRFDPDDEIQFYGEGLDTPWTDTRVYWLVEGSRPGKRITFRRGRGSRQGDSSFPFTVERKDRTIYFAALKNGDEENFFGPVVAADPVEQLLYLRHLEPFPPEEAQLEVALQGVTVGPHRVMVQLNGTNVGEMSFQGQTLEATSFSVPQAWPWLQDGTNTVTLIAQGGETDVSVVDVIRLTYWHTYTAEDNALRFTTPGKHTVRVKGFNTRQIRVVDVTDPENVMELKTVVRREGSGFSVKVKVPGGRYRTLLAFAEDRVKQPLGLVFNKASRWHGSDQEAQLVIISHGAFVQRVDPLKSLREQEGWCVAVINVEDLYDEFSFGAKTPWALRDFIGRARARWELPPRFVLLVGDASFDPRNYLGLGDFDLVPTKLVDTAFLETASDDWFVDQDDDGLPELAMGRLPVRSLQEASTVFSKIVGYALDGSGAWRNEALMVADRNDGFDFEGACRDVESLLPEEMVVTEVFRGQTDNETARTDLLNSLNEGPLLVNYMGHGSVEVWRGNLLTSEDALALTNGLHLPVVLSMTCLNGMFHDLYTESLAEALLKAPQGGAVAVWTSSGLTYPQGQALLNREMVRLLFNGDEPTLGEAAMQAKAAVADQDVRRTWILFGDPTTRID